MKQHGFISNKSTCLLAVLVKQFSTKARRGYVLGGGPDLHVAIRRGDIDSTRQLIQDGDELNHVDKRPSVGMGSPLHVAVHHHRLHIAKQLLENQADPTVFDKKGRTPLHLCGENGDVNMAALLLSAGVDVNIASVKTTTTPLHLAIRNRHTPMVHELIMKGADPNILDGHGVSAVHAAVSAYDKQQLQIILRSPKVDVNVNDKLQRSPIIAAAHAKDLEAIEMLLQAGCDMNFRDRRGRTALHWCALNLKSRIVQKLCEYGADANRQDKKGWTPLHVMMIHKVIHGLVDAPAKERTTIIQTLVNHGANVNAIDMDRNTPLHLAAKIDARHVMLKRLLKNGADVFARNDDGKEPSDIAQENNATKNYQLLEYYKRKQNSQVLVVGNQENYSIQG
eukprot:TRINITY_DN16675_c0_g2_i1.p1 TRINITY_DN16675_c0_g2~~TRINITY_DN16675_c0_g2_i1.p1  ORF type:complete len:394 (-),score=38.50 TRINITY_DN16675_c0_g2_i1:239-1420(-)